MTTTLRLLAAIVATTAVSSHALFVGPHGAITTAGRACRRAPVTARDAARSPHADFDVASDSALPRAAALRQLGGSTAALAASWALRPARVSAAQNMMLNEDGEYVELDEAASWTDSWGSRLGKASQMSPDQIRMAARGAGNVREGEVESPKAQKRRAFAGCREASSLARSGGGDEKTCVTRVTGGDVDFMLDTLDGPKAAAARRAASEAARAPAAAAPAPAAADAPPAASEAPTQAVEAATAVEPAATAAAE